MAMLAVSGAAGAGSVHPRQQKVCPYCQRSLTSRRQLRSFVTNWLGIISGWTLHKHLIKYRAVIVLCDLQGKTRKEAARQLKIPEGTLSSRLAKAKVMLAKAKVMLAKAKVMLAKRLARHGRAG